MTEVLFIHANSSNLVYQGLSSKHSAIEPPIWMGLLSSHCTTQNISNLIINCETSPISYKEITDIILYEKPLIVCFVVYGQQPSASSQNMEGAISLAQYIKDELPSQKILFVGGHVSALPKETLTYDCIDMVCQNEGVYTLSNLIKCLRANDMLSKVNGLGYKESGHIILNPLSSIVAEQDLVKDIPGIYENDFSKYRTAGWHSWTNNSEKTPFASLYTSLGCPFGCSFCMINIINKNKDTPRYNIYRKWPVDHIMKQFMWLADHNVKNIKIADELFVYDQTHFITICQEIIKRKLQFNIWCYARIDTCQQKYLDIMKMAGINFIGLGIESANKYVRKDVTKGRFDDINIKQTVDHIHNAGMEIGANYIFGLPEDNEKSLQETLDLSIYLNTSMVNYYCAMAYPGSKLYNEAVKRKVKLPDRFCGYSQHSYYTQPLPSNHLSAEYILKFRDDSWIQYHQRSEYLNMMTNKFGERASKNIKDMLDIKMKRQILGD